MTIMTTASLNRRLRTACEEFQISKLFNIDLRQEIGIANCPKINSTSDVVSVFENVAQIDHEVLISASIDSKRRLVQWNVVALGNAIRSDRLRIIDAIYGAVLSRATRIVLIQIRKKDSGSPTVEDLNISRKIARAGELLGYPVIDHVMIGAEGYWNLAPLRKPMEQFTQTATTRSHKRILAS